MLNKSSTLKQLLDESIITWFKQAFTQTLQEAKDNLLMVINNYNGGVAIPTSAEEIENEVQFFVDEMNLLKTIEEIKAFAESAKRDIGNLATSEGLSFENLTHFFQQGGSMTKMLIKANVGINVGKFIDVIGRIETIKAKLGYETTLDEIDYADLKYLLMKTLDKDLESLTYWMSEHKHDADQIVEEVEKIKGNSTFEEKQEPMETIMKYFTKFKGEEIIGSLANIENINQGIIADEVKEFAHIFNVIETLNQIIKLSLIIKNNFKVITN